MPTYLYVCSHCQHQMEAFQKITDSPLDLCPQCKKKTLQRAIGGQKATLMKSTIKENSSCCSCHGKCKH